MEKAVYLVKESRYHGGYDVAESNVGVFSSEAKAREWIEGAREHNLKLREKYSVKDLAIRYSVHKFKIDKLVK